MLFAIVISIFAGMSTDSAAYNQSTKYLGNLTGDTSKSLYEDALNNFISPAVLGSTAIIALGAYFLGGGFTVVIAAGAVAYLAVYILSSMDVITALGLPHPINIILLAFINLMLLIGLFGFIRGKNV